MLEDDETDEEEEEEEEEENDVPPTADDVPAEDDSQRRDFDTDIPTTHLYLGTLNAVRGYTLYDHGQIVDLPMISTSTLTFPGFTLPLMLAEPVFKEGFTFVHEWELQHSNTIKGYGVIMEVFEMGGAEGETVAVKARARQRCRFLQTHPRRNWPFRRFPLRVVRVRVLDEPPHASPLACSELSALKQRFPCHGDYDDHRASDSKYRKVHLAQFPYPAWVYDQFDVEHHARRLRARLVRSYAPSGMPCDATALSFWFGQNFTLTDEERRALLAADTTLARLQEASRYAALHRHMVCDACGALLALQRDVFAMSKDGTQSNYVNPGGVNYETITVRAARNFQLQSQPNTDFSWFPGYAWTIIACTVCRAHIGWLFTAAAALTPKSFFALARSSLNIILIDEGGPNSLPPPNPRIL